MNNIPDNATKADCAMMIIAAQDETERLRAQRDELAAALRALIANAEHEVIPNFQNLRAARAALAKVGGAS